MSELKPVHQITTYHSLASKQTMLRTHGQSPLLHRHTIAQQTGTDPSGAAPSWLCIEKGDKTQLGQLGIVNVSLQHLEGCIYYMDYMLLYYNIYIIYYYHIYHLMNNHITSHITGFLKNITQYTLPMKPQKKQHSGSGAITCVSSKTSWSNFVIAKPDASVMGPFRFGLAPCVGSWSFQARWVALVQHVLEFQVWQYGKEWSRHSPNPGFTMDLPSECWIRGIDSSRPILTVILGDFALDLDGWTVWSLQLSSRKTLRKCPNWGGFHRKIICK